MQDVIIVLGMHRCGTSTISGMFCRAGYQIGNNPQRTDFFNPKGYFENTRFGIFNNDLLSFFGASWCDTLKLPENWWNDPLLDPYKERLLKIFLEEFTGKAQILIKDPRISILLPFYTDVFRQLKILPKFIVNFRDPQSVALSLKMRNNLSFSRSMAIWMDHLLRAERLTRDSPRFLLYYDDLLKDPVGVFESILLQFSSMHLINPAVSANILAFVDPSLRHNSGSAEGSGRVPEDTMAVFEKLLYYRFRDKDPQFTGFMDRAFEKFSRSVPLFTGIDGKPEAMLQAVSEDDARVTLFQPCFLGDNRFEFRFEPDILAKRLIFLPFSHRVRLRCNGLTISGIEQPEQFIPFHSSNQGLTTQEGVQSFFTVNPELGCYFDEPVRLGTVRINLQILDYGEPESLRGH